MSAAFTLLYAKQPRHTAASLLLHGTAAKVGQTVCIPPILCCQCRRKTAQDVEVLGPFAAKLSVVQVNTTPEGSSQPQKAAAKAAAGSLTPAAGQDNSVMDVLENTLWNRQLGVMSEEIVAALVCQIFEGAPLTPGPHLLHLPTWLVMAHN